MERRNLIAALAIILAMNALAAAIPPPLVEMPFEQVDIKIQPYNGVLRATFSGDYTFTYIVSFLEKIEFPVPPDANNISGWMNGTPLSHQWSSRTIPSILPEFPVIPVLGWLGPFPHSGGILKVQYEHGLIKRLGEFIYFSPFILDRGTATTVTVKIQIPAGFAVAGVWLRNIPQEYSVNGRQLEMSFQTHTAPIYGPAELLVSLVPTTLYVSTDGNDFTGDGSENNPFRTIQKGINTAANGCTVIVQPGTYTENTNLRGNNITLRSTDPADEDVVGNTIIDGNDVNSVVTFSGAETSSCVLSGFTITHGKAPEGGGIYGNGTKATVQNNIIVANRGVGYGMPGSYGAGGGILDCDGLIQHNIIKNNYAGFGGGLMDCDGLIQHNIISYNRWYAGAALTSCNGTIRNNLIMGNLSIYGGALASCNGTITNCTIVGNGAPNGSALFNCAGGISNCIIWHNGPGLNEQLKNCSTPAHTCIEYWSGTGTGNIAADPCFADPGYWDQNGTPENPGDDTWISGDYHLKSQAGRWNANEGRWTKDEVISPCIDAGDPATPVGLEPFPNGGIINMGAYGGTTETSKSYFGEPICEVIVAGDINGDCKVDFKDFVFVALHWLEER